MGALKLTLSMLKKPEMDFLRLNEQAGITDVPKVHAAQRLLQWHRQPCAAHLDFAGSF
jgi:hypothetical protein